MRELINSYISRLNFALTLDGMNHVPLLGSSLLDAKRCGRQVYLCGNGGSAGNAIHLANDFLYGVSKIDGAGLCVEALSANSSVLTCLANDVGYENIYSEQLRIKARPNDILIVLSGSGNSSNIINALVTGNKIGMKTFAILGYSGGQCKDLAQHPIHFNINDMQIAEDLQLIVGHMCMQWLQSNPCAQ